MNDTPLAFTVTEAREVARRPRFWIVLACVAAVLALTGPFGTYDTLGLAARAAYWGAATVGCFWLGMVTSLMTATQAEDWRVPAPLAQIIGGIVAGIPVAAAVALLNVIAFGDPFTAGFGRVLPYAATIAVIVGVIYEMVERREAATAEARHSGNGSTPQTGDTAVAVLFDRLPPAIGRDIVHLQAQDHYVAVRTLKGEALVLISMADATEALGARGMRVHRSWWVSRAHMRDLTYRNGAPRLVTSLGDEIPVGRSHRRAVRVAVRGR